MEGGAEKMEASPNTIEHTFFNYLNEFLYETSESQKQQSPIFLKRQDSKSIKFHGHAFRILGTSTYTEVYINCLWISIT